MSDFTALLLSLPSGNSTLRMRLWRALKATGCAVLRDGVRNDETLTIDELYARSEAIAAQLGRSDPRTGAVASDFVGKWYINHDEFDRADKLLTRAIDSLPKELPGRSSPQLLSNLRNPRDFPPVAPLLPDPSTLKRSPFYMTAPVGGSCPSQGHRARSW